MELECVVASIVVPSGVGSFCSVEVDLELLGWKCSILTDRNGIPIGVAIDGANHNDSATLAPTVDDVRAKALPGHIETIWLDRGYDSGFTRERLATLSPTPSSPRRASAGPPSPRQPADGSTLAGRTH